MKNPLEEKLEQLRANAGSEPPTLEQVAQSYDKLNFVVPVEIVDLPSRGKLYPEGHPLHGKSSVEIRQMTAKDEDILTNRSYIKKGVVIDKFVESVLVDKSIPVQSLLVGDKNAIVIASRITGYGPEYDVAVTCENCITKSNRSINLLEAESKSGILDAPSNENYSLLSNGNILIKLPKRGWIAECKMLNGSDEVNLIKLAEERRKKFDAEDITGTEQLKIIVKSINGVSDPQVLSEAVENIPVSDAKYLRDTYAELVPSVKIKHKFTCGVCLEAQDVEVPFTQEFFWPKR